MGLVHTLISFAVAILVLVTVHEFGHFYVARRCGVKVLRFSIGFGKVVWSRSDSQGTEYTLCALPLGGYVKMLDEREGDVPEHLLHQAYTRKTVYQRMAIVMAGPIANFLLAIILFWGLLLGGETQLRPVIGYVKADSIAHKAGLEAGQEIVAVDGHSVQSEHEVVAQLLNRLGQSGDLVLTVRYSESSSVGLDQSLTYDIHCELNEWMSGVKDPDPLDGLGIEIPPVAAVVGEITPAGAAEKAGFQKNDRILSVALEAREAEKITDWREWVNVVKANPNKMITTEVNRPDYGIKILTVTPETFIEPESFLKKEVSYGRVGMGPAPIDEKLLTRKEFGLFEAWIEGVSRSWETAGFVLLSVKKLILGEISTKNLSGPISIAKVAGSSAEVGIKSFIGFLASLSVFLAVFNVLPIPVLDGGHMVYLIIEAFRGKPVSEKVQILGFQIGLSLVIGLSVVAMYNDILRL